MTDPVRDASRTIVTRFASRLKFPQLFAVVLILFLLDLLIPDLIPFADELLLGLATVLLGSWKQEKPAVSKPPAKDITPEED
jgi:hypothetical protein